MSNHLAIATVTGALNFRLNQVVMAEMPSAQVTNLRPNAPSGLPAPGVNIFLYQVTPNVAQRNSDLSTRRSDGTLVKRPVAALDLHYMLSFYGDESQWEPQILLGAVVRAMHARPSIDSATINAMLADPSHLFDPLLLTNLMDAPDSVRFTPTALTFEEMSKLWGIFYQIPYVLSVAYMASVVLIEADLLPRTALPVRSFQVGVVPLEPPRLFAALSSSGTSDPLDPSDQLILTGVALLGGDTQTVLIDGSPAVVADATAERYVVNLPAGITAGVHTVRLMERVQVTPTYSSVVESNLKVFAVRPGISSVLSSTTSTSTETSVEIRVNMSAATSIGPRQRLQVALTRVAGGPAYFLEAKLDATTSPLSAVTILSAPGTTAPIDPGTYLVRVFVDGVPSALGPDGGPYATPTVTVT